MTEDIDVTEETKKENSNKAILWDDIANLEDLEGEENYEVDESADAFSREAPPVPGTYDFLITVDSEAGITQRNLVNRRSKEKVNYYSVSLVFTAKSDDVNVDGANVYVNASTLYNPKKKTSTLITILSKMGVKVSDINSSASQLRRLKEFVDSEPIKALTVDWELSYKSGTDSKTGKDVYSTMCSSFKDFPIDKSTKSGRKEVFNIKLKDGGMVEARPRLKVISFNPNAAKSVSSNSGGTVVNIGPKKGKIVVSKEVEDLEKELG